MDIVPKQASVTNVGLQVHFERVCQVTDQTYRVVVDRVDVRRWKQGELIQNVWPNMSSDDREILMSGFTPAEWDMLFPEE
tara:strand:+ start:456 stop:695 length:240 start_codon:yes stop_codon:yes gene_type:complete